MDTDELLQSIIHCDEVTKEFSHPRVSHPCCTIIRSQGCSSEKFHVPEPWNGNITQAPLLFISSNPSINNNELYPVNSWEDKKVFDFFTNRFDGRWVQNFRTRLVNREFPDQGSRYWFSVRMRAAEILGLEKDQVIPGKHYAITEVVHCKSVKEIGVKKALHHCSEKYLREILQVSPAKVVVILGDIAKAGLKLVLKDEGVVPAENALLGPMNLFENIRVFLFLPHPNRWGGPKSVRDNFGSMELKILKDCLS